MKGDKTLQYERTQRRVTKSTKKSRRKGPGKSGGSKELTIRRLPSESLETEKV